MKYRLLIGAFIVFSLSSCIKSADNAAIPEPVISFYEGRDYWNNPIYLRGDTVLNGLKPKSLMAHFAAAAGIKKILVTRNGATIHERIEDNETDFNDEFLCFLDPEGNPAVFNVLFRVEDWNGRSAERKVRVEFK